MAESRMMTPADVVAQVMGGEHGDVSREAVALVAGALMEAEVSTRVGAEHGERSPDRVAHRNGYRPRAWETRVGELELLIPRVRSGPAYFPSFLEPRRRCAGDRRGRDGGLRQRREHAQGRPAR
jgi:transposase-like protein